MWKNFVNSKAFRKYKDYFPYPTSNFETPADDILPNEFLGILFFFYLVK